MASAEPSSFRDQSSRVYLCGDTILRGFGKSAGASFREAHAIGVLPTLVGEGRIIEYRFTRSGNHPDIVPSSVVVETDRLPFVSVPSEWSFSMLKDAALLTLDINLALLDHGFMLKDASAFNVTFRGASPVFLDLGSIEPFGDSGIWAAYGQFVDHFLTPLMLEAHAGVAFQPRLRGAIDGIPTAEANSVLRGRARRKPGVFTHIALRGRLEKSASSLGKEQRTAVSATALPRDAVKSTIAKMRKLVDSLISESAGVWSDYESAPPYEAEELEAKRQFVVRCAGAIGGDRLIDVGANTGYFTRAVASEFESSLAIDVDAGAVDRLYQRLLREDVSGITPLVIDLLNPTPAMGWKNAERASFLDRVDADLALWLAVLHHLTITGGIPLGHSLSLASELSSHAVIEFVLPTDPMVELISASGSTEAAPYDEETFARELESRFDVIEVFEPKPTRRLYFARSRM